MSNCAFIAAKVATCDCRASSIAETFLRQGLDESNEDASQALALLTVSFLGSSISADTANSGAMAALLELMRQQHLDDIVSWAASRAAGGVCAGNTSASLPLLLEALTSSTASVHLPLITLKEALQRHAPFVAEGPNFTSQVPSVIPTLMKLVQSADDGL